MKHNIHVQAHLRDFLKPSASVATNVFPNVCQVTMNQLASDHHLFGVQPARRPLNFCNFPKEPESSCKRW